MFVIRVQDDNGKVTERKYKLNTPIVKRVLAPGEEQQDGEARGPGTRSAEEVNRVDPDALVWVAGRSLAGVAVGSASRLAAGLNILCIHLRMRL